MGGVERLHFISNPSPDDNIFRPAAHKQLEVELPLPLPLRPPRTLFDFATSQPASQPTTRWARAASRTGPAFESGRRPIDQCQATFSLARVPFRVSPQDRLSSFRLAASCSRWRKESKVVGPKGARSGQGYYFLGAGPGFDCSFSNSRFRRSHSSTISSLLLRYLDPAQRQPTSSGLGHLIQCCPCRCPPPTTTTGSLSHTLESSHEPYFAFLAQP